MTLVIKSEHGNGINFKKTVHKIVTYDFNYFMY